LLKGSDLKVLSTDRLDP